MIWSGYVSHGLLYEAIGAEIPAYLTGFEAGAASLAISVLELINALGGVVVVIGGIFLVSGHGRTGRILILLGGGAGLLGLLASFGYTIYKLGAEQIIYYAPYWVGLLLAVTARRIAKGAKGGQAQERVTQAG